MCVCDLLSPLTSAQLVLDDVCVYFCIEVESFTWLCARIATRLFEKNHRIASVTGGISNAMIYGCDSAGDLVTKTGDKTPKGREFTQHGAEQANNRGLLQTMHIQTDKELGITHFHRNDVLIW